MRSVLIDEGAVVKSSNEVKDVLVGRVADMEISRRSCNARRSRGYNYWRVTW